MQKTDYRKEMEGASRKHEQMPDAVVITVIVFHEKEGSGCVEKASDH